MMKFAALLFTALTIVTTAPAAAAGAGPTEIQVTGSGSVSMIPDIATVDAAISTTTLSSQQALSENNAIYERAVNALLAAGVARNDISLSSYNINYVPKPQHPQNGDAPYGFTVSRTFLARTKTLGKAGAIVDAMVGAGVTNVNSVTFGIADASAAQRRALEAAVQDARDKADALAAGSHLHITGIKTITYGEVGIRPPVPVAYMMAKATPTQLDPGSENVTTSVSITYLASP